MDVLRSFIFEDNILQSLLDVNVIPLEKVITKDFYFSTKVFLNGRLVGIHYNPSYLFRYMKLLKLNSFINITTSISWNIQTNEIYVFCDSGRIIRPIFYLKEGEDGQKYTGWFIL